MDGLVKDLDRINQAIARERMVFKNLVQSKQRIERQLYTFMKDHNIQEYNGIKLGKVTPKNKIPRKTKKQKKIDTIDYFIRIGLPNPEETFDELCELQKNHI